MTEIKDGVVRIHNSDYFTVARRIKDFRKEYPDYTIKTKVMSNADLILIKASISSQSGRVISTGYAEEIRGATQILKTSALETCETSAVGRALAFFGYAGTEIASAEEIAQAQAQQEEAVNETINRLKAHNSSLRDNIESVVSIKHYLLNDDYGSAYEAYAELTDDDKQNLTLAPTKGGIFTTDEVKKLRSNEWTAARREYHGLTEEGKDE